MANIITYIRIICSIALLFCPVFSPMFYILYIAAGLSDMIDGAVARKTGTASDFGAKMDTVADFILVSVCMIKFLPVMHIPIWLTIWICMIAVIKTINLVLGYVLRKDFVTVHSVMNKITGIALFLLPFTISSIDLKYSGVFICALATFAAIQEGYQ